MKTIRSRAGGAQAVTWVLVPALAVLAGAEPAAEKPQSLPPEVACKNLNAAAQRMSDEAVQYMRSHGHKSLVVGPFLGPPRGIGGQRLTQAIKSRLPKEIEVLPGPSAVALVGRYKLRKEKDSKSNDLGKSSVVIEANLTDAVGEPLVNLTTCVLTDAASIQSLMATRAGGVKPK